jgi:flagellar basal-body rod protein FlgB
MPDPITSDRAMRNAQFALDGLSRQQEVISQNLANIDTPAYHAQTVDFQSALHRALEDGGDALQGSPQRVSMVTTRQGHLPSTDRPDQVQFSLRKGGSLRADGNNVDVDVEMSQMAETGIQYQAISQLVSKKLLLLKNIASGR